MDLREELALPDLLKRFSLLCVHQTLPVNSSVRIAEPSEAVRAFGLAEAKQPQTGCNLGVLCRRIPKARVQCLTRHSSPVEGLREDAQQC